MFGIRRISLLAAATLTVVGLGMSSPLPASATTFTVTSLSCEPHLSSLLCDGSVNGGTGGNSYHWTPGGSQSNFANSSSLTFGCQIGSWYTVSMTVTDSSGATASRSIRAACSGGNQ